MLRLCSNTLLQQRASDNCNNLTDKQIREPGAEVKKHQDKGLRVARKTSLCLTKLCCFLQVPCTYRGTTDVPPAQLAET